MRRHALAAFFLFALVGCAATPPTAAPYGDFIGAQAPAGLSEKLALDTVKQLVVLYPPANTRFDLGQPAVDAFGTALVDALRLRGYGLLEFKPQVVAARAAAPGLSLRYLLDAPATTDLYRVTVLVGSTSLSRAYVAHGDGVFAAGAWVRKE